MLNRELPNIIPEQCEMALKAMRPGPRVIISDPDTLPPQASDEPYPSNPAGGYATRYVIINGWDFGEAHGLGSHEAPMAGDYTSVGISRNRVYKAERSDRRDDLIYLLFGMRPRIARVRSKRA